MCGDGPDESREALEGGNFVDAHPLDHGPHCRRVPVTRPSEPEPCPALDRVEVRDRLDRTDVRHGKSPRHAFIGLPIDDLLERRQPARHALRCRAHATPPADRHVLHHQRAFPQRPQRRGREMGPYDRGVRRDGRRDIKNDVGCDGIDAADAGLGLPTSLQVEREGRDPAQMLDRELTRPQAKSAGLEIKGPDRVVCEQREAIAHRPGSRRPLQQTVHEDDVRPSQLVPTGDASTNERAVVHEEFEVEPGRQPARVAVAARGPVDAPQPTPECDVGRLDRVEEQRAVGPPVLDEEECRIALELGQPERWFQAADDRLEEVARDRRRMLDLTSGQVRRVPGEVRDDQEPRLGCRCHGGNARPWSRSNVNSELAWPCHTMLRNRSFPVCRQAPECSVLR